MGKGGGCVPSKKKVLISDLKKNDPVSESIGTQSQVPESTTTAVGEAPTEAKAKKLRVFIVYYSMYGQVELLAREIKKGVDSIEGVEGVLYRVAETLPKAVLEMMKAPPKDESVPVMTAQKLAEADGVIFGFPTRFGSMAAQMKAFFDSTGQLWREQKLAGKPAGLFVSTGTQGGGQETTAWTAITQLVHHGMIYVPVGYTFGAGMFEMESVKGGTPYGAGVFAGDGTRKATDTELALAEHQGKLMATTVKKLALTS